MTRTLHYSNPAFVLALLSVPAWAGDVEVPGIHNFHQVDSHVYRGGQPADEAWRGLAGLGVKTVIDLRRDGEGGHSIAAEARAVRAAGMRYVSVPMNGVVAPDGHDIAKVLGILNSGEPVFVHCKEGKDRTGTVVACYRIAHDRWQNDQALREAKSYGLHWVEFGMRGYIQDFRGATQVAGAGGEMGTVGAEQ